MTAQIRARVQLHLQHLAWRYLPTRQQVEDIWQNWLGWAVVVGIVVGTAVVVVWVMGRWGL